MGSVADSGTTVLLSSHLLADLERVCDYLIVLQAARVQLAGPVDDLVAAHRQLVGPRHGGGPIDGVAAVVRASHTDRQSTLLVRTDGPVTDPAVDGARRDPGGPRPGLPRRGRDPDQPRRVGGAGMIWLTWRQHRKQALFTLLGVRRRSRP